jgi:hypothetical protein
MVAGGGDECLAGAQVPMLISPNVIPANVVVSIYNRSQGSGVTYSWHSQPGNPYGQSEPQTVEDNRLTANEPGGCSIAQRGQLNACHHGKETSCAHRKGPLSGPRSASLGPSQGTRQSIKQRPGSP